MYICIVNVSPYPSIYYLSPTLLSLSISLSIYILYNNVYTYIYIYIYIYVCVCCVLPKKQHPSIFTPLI